jgi:hypothetical protein
MPTWVVIAILAVAAMWAVDHGRKVRQIRKLRLEHRDIDVRVSRGFSTASIELASPQARAWYIKNVEFAPKYIPSFRSTFVFDLAAAGQIIRAMVRDHLIIDVEGGTLADFSASGWFV